MMDTDNKPGWCPQDLWDETSSAFDVLYESEPDLEGGCEYGIQSMAAFVAMVAIATERERCAKVCEAVGSDADPQLADHLASAIRAAPQLTERVTE